MGKDTRFLFVIRKDQLFFIYIINIDTMITTEKEKIELASCMPPTTAFSL